MNKRLEELLERAAAWPPDAQEDVVLTLEGIEARVIANSGLSIEQQEAKVAALREMIRNSIARGGSYTDEQVEASISTELDAREQDRKSA